MHFNEEVLGAARHDVMAVCKKHWDEGSHFRPGTFGSTDGCPDVGGRSIMDEVLCRVAAKHLKYKFNSIVNQPSDYPGCMVRPATSEVWYNTASSPRGSWEFERVGQLCFLPPVQDAESDDGTTVMTIAKRPKPRPPIIVKDEARPEGLLETTGWPSTTHVVAWAAGSLAATTAIVSGAAYHRQRRLPSRAAALLPRGETASGSADVLGENLCDPQE